MNIPLPTEADRAIDLLKFYFNAANHGGYDVMAIIRLLAAERASKAAILKHAYPDLTAEEAAEMIGKSPAGFTLVSGDSRIKGLKEQLAEQRALAAKEAK